MTEQCIDYLKLNYAMKSISVCFWALAFTALHVGVQVRMRMQLQGAMTPCFGQG